MGIWPDCTKDDICVPAGCECKAEFDFVMNFERTGKSIGHAF